MKTRAIPQDVVDNFFEGESPFFPGTAIEEHNTQHNTEGNTIDNTQDNTQHNTDDNTGVMDSVVGIVTTRGVQRRTFELYVDQLDILKQLDDYCKAKHKKPFNKSGFIRKILDEAFKKRGLM